MYRAMFVFVAMTAAASAEEIELPNEQIDAMEARAYLDAAEVHCPFRADSRMIGYVSAKSYGSGEPTFDEKVAVATAMQDAQEKVDAIAAADPLTFCRMAWESFGPDGLVIPGILERK